MTVVPFVPSTSSPFQFQLTLGGSDYTAIVTWNLFGQRFYFNLYTVQGALVVAIPLAGSPVDYDINLVEGYFDTSKVVYRAPNRQFEITP